MHGIHKLMHYLGISDLSDKEGYWTCPIKKDINGKFLDKEDGTTCISRV
jgi:hypothetical protein